MPIFYKDVVQGSDTWLRLRCGLPTASGFDQIMTPGGKASKSAERYMHSLIAERLMDHPIIEHVSFWMDRGSQMESEAVDFYSFQRDCPTEKIGFVLNDSKTIGASPDRLVGDTGLLEIKIPAPHTQVQYLLRKAVDASYYPQIQGQLWIAEREWVDILSYHPEMPPALIRVERDDRFIADLREVVLRFSEVLEDQYQILSNLGMVQHKTARPVSVVDAVRQALVDIQR